MIQFSNISKSYNPGLFKKRVQAVNHLNLTILEGQVFGLIGPNGAGKSTSIRMLLGLIRPDTGEIKFGGKSLREISIQKEIGYLPENPYLYDHLNLSELLKFCGRTSGLKNDEMKRRSWELLAKLNLLDAQKQPLRTFSKGMLQRAGICFALLHNPSIVILDEPMSGLDPVGRKMVFDLVMELKEQGKTIFFCSHILNDVERLCDRIGLMNKGTLVREFDRNDFSQKMSGAVFLKTAALPSSIQGDIEQLGGVVRDETDGFVLAIPVELYYEINSLLEKSRIKILGCRSEWVSLENLFMQTVKEQNQ